MYQPQNLSCSNSSFQTQFAPLAFGSQSLNFVNFTPQPIQIPTYNRFIEKARSTPPFSAPVTSLDSSIVNMGITPISPITIQKIPVSKEVPLAYHVDEPQSIDRYRAVYESAKLHKPAGNFKSDQLALLYASVKRQIESGKTLSAAIRKVVKLVSEHLSQFTGSLTSNEMETLREKLLKKYKDLCRRLKEENKGLHLKDLIGTLSDKPTLNLSLLAQPVRSDIRKQFEHYITPTKSPIEAGSETLQIENPLTPLATSLSTLGSFDPITITNVYSATPPPQSFDGYVTILRFVSNQSKSRKTYKKNRKKFKQDQIEVFYASIQNLTKKKKSIIDSVKEIVDLASDHITLFTHSLEPSEKKDLVDSLNKRYFAIERRFRGDSEFAELIDTVSAQQPNLSILTEPVRPDIRKQYEDYLNTKEEHA